MNTKSNIETRISNRAKSIFSSFGAIVNDFYLEAGIYFVGGFNAALVAWDIYTDLLASQQPIGYAVTVAIIAFIAVEGLAVYLVGAAAKANNKLLWFFSVVFACFFTYAHYRQMNSQGDISQYITLAIPFFVVVGYWARTVKAETENNNDLIVQAAKDESERNRQLADEALDYKRETERLKIANQQEIKLAKLEAKTANFDGQNGGFLPENGQKLANANEAKKDKIVHRRQQILAIKKDEKLTQSELAQRLGVSLGTIKNDLRALNGSSIQDVAK